MAKRRSEVERTPGTENFREDDTKEGIEEDYAEGDGQKDCRKHGRGNIGEECREAT